MKRTRKKGALLKGASVEDLSKGFAVIGKAFNSRTPDLILGSDWHLREDQPVSRTDDFEEAQWNKIDQVASLQRKFNCPVFHAGDLFHHWKPSPYLLAKSKQHLPKDFWTIYGQHDLPQHNFELRNKSGINDLEVSNFATVPDGGNWGQDPKTHIEIKGRKVVMIHRFVWDGEKIPWPGCEELTARQVLAKYPEFDLIVTGDHHKPFTQALKGRLLVNCGCLTRQEASYANHKHVYGYGMRILIQSRSTSWRLLLEWLAEIIWKEEKKKTSVWKLSLLEYLKTGKLGFHLKIIWKGF